MVGVSFQALLMRRVSAVTSLSHITSVAASTATITWPTIAAGDVAHFVEAVLSAGAPPAASVPSGFTQIATASRNVAASSRIVSSYKILTGTETGSFGAMTGTNYDKTLTIFRGNVPITGISVQDIGTEATTGNPAAQTVTSAGGVAPLLVFGCYNASSAVNPRTFTVGGIGAKDGEIGTTGDFMYQAWKIYNSAPADAVIDMDDEGSENLLMSYYLQVT